MAKRVQGVEFDSGTRRVRHVAFADGTRVEADLYIEAVGKESALRAALYPGRVFGPVLVREMVSHTVAPDMADILATRFLKYQDPRGGLAVGLVPCGQGRLLWYVQFDAQRHPFTGTTGAERAAQDICERRGGDTREQRYQADVIRDDQHRGGLHQFLKTGIPS